MLLPEVIKQSLIQDLHFNFEVVQKDGIVKVIQDPINNSSFFLDVRVSEADRLTIVCEPDKYGVDFVNTISQSTKDQRISFCNYWKQLSLLHSKMEIKLNDRIVNPDEFCSFDDDWEKIYIRFTTLPFYDEEKDNKQEKLIDYIELVCSMILSLCEVTFVGEVEGDHIMTVSRHYERNPINRKLCLMLKGYQCSVCGFDFEKKYGQIGKNFIEVHHVIPVSVMGPKYQVNPMKDLVPLCSNCHSMIHRKNVPYTVEELKEIVEKIKCN